MTIKFGKFGNFAHFIVRNFVVVWEAPIGGGVWGRVQGVGEGWFSGEGGGEGGGGVGTGKGTGKSMRTPLSKLPLSEPPIWGRQKGLPRFVPICSDVPVFF